jgi:co-chaperonin GroES (HSP10)
MRYLTPLDNRVLLLRLEAPQETQSGLFIPNSVKLKEFEIIALGAGANPLLSVGQTVWCDRNDFVVQLDEQKFVLVKDTEIGGVIEDGVEQVFQFQMPEA